jgi:hypothetical protein
VPGVDGDLAAEEYAWQMLSNAAAYPSADTATEIRMLNVGADLAEVEAAERPFYQVHPLNRLAKYAAPWINDLQRPRPLLTLKARSEQLLALQTSHDDIRENQVMRGRRASERHRLLFGYEQTRENLDASAANTLFTEGSASARSLALSAPPLPEEEEERVVVVTAEADKSSQQEKEVGELIEGEDEEDERMLSLNATRYRVQSAQGMEVIFTSLSEFKEALADFVTRIRFSNAATRIATEGKLLETIKLGGHVFEFDHGTSDLQGRNSTSLGVALKTLSQLSLKQTAKANLVFVARPVAVAAPSEQLFLALVTKKDAYKSGTFSQPLIIFPTLLVSKTGISDKMSPVTFVSDAVTILTSRELQTRTDHVTYDDLQIIWDDKEILPAGKFARKADSIVGDGSRFRPLLFIDKEKIDPAYADVTAYYEATQ